MSIKSGLYKHYKGGTYRVFHIVKHSETVEDLVYYEDLKPERTFQYWVRPLSMFLEDVQVDGKTMPRFTYIGE